MYSQKHNCIFVHQRKSAGTSIKTLFPDATGEFNDGVLDKQWYLDPRVPKSFKFTVVRNPWDRFISGWKYCISTRYRELEDVLLNLPRENLLENVIGRSSWIARFFCVLEFSRRSTERTFVAALNALTTQSRRLPSDSGHDFRHLTRQQFATVAHEDGSLAVDAVFFLEALDEGLEFLAGKIGVDPHSMKAKKVRRSEDDYRRYFNDRTLEMFNQKFPVDTKVWSYDFHAGPGVPPKKTIIFPNGRNSSGG
jgi:hypothetical protein